MFGGELFAFVTSPLGKWILGAIGIALFLGGLYHHVWHNGYVKGEASIQADWDADKQRRVKAFSDAMTKYVTAQAEADAKQKALDAERQGRIDDAKKRAKGLPPADAGLRFPGNAASVLDDAADHPTETARPADKSASGPAVATQDSTVGLVTQWAVDVIGFYNACRDQVIGWQSFYHALQQAQPEVTP